MRRTGQSGHGSGDNGPNLPTRARPEILAKKRSSLHLTQATGPESHQ